MSTKVVHLSIDAHTLAKKHCKEHGLKMSDWVATLIRQAISDSKKDTITSNVRNFVAKKSVIVPTSDDRHDETPAWAQPPFWAQRARNV